MPVAATGERNRTSVGSTRAAMSKSRMPLIEEAMTCPKSSPLSCKSMNPKP